jgi:hypothetical protein
VDLAGSVFGVLHFADHRAAQVEMGGVLVPGGSARLVVRPPPERLAHPRIREEAVQEALASVDRLVCAALTCMPEYTRCDAPSEPGLRCRAVSGRAGNAAVDWSFPMAAAADRNLHFGLLALQNGLIDQDQLVAAFRVWSRD